MHHHSCCLSHVAIRSRATTDQMACSPAHRRPPSQPPPRDIDSDIDDGANCAIWVAPVAAAAKCFWRSHVARCALNHRLLRLLGLVSRGRSPFVGPLANFVLFRKSAGRKNIERRQLDTEETSCAYRRDYKQGPNAQLGAATASVRLAPPRGCKLESLARACYSSLPRCHWTGTNTRSGRALDTTTAIYAVSCWATHDSGRRRSRATSSPNGTVCASEISAQVRGTYNQLNSREAAWAWSSRLLV